MNRENFLKWERQRTQGQVRFIVTYALKFAAAYLLASFIFGPLWPLLKGADMHTLLNVEQPVSWWIRKITVPVAMGLGVGLYQWDRTEKAYKKHLESEVNV